jgi:hypothetical protein
MLVEPDLDRRMLAAVLDEHYGLAVRRLRFVPAGETAWCYRLTDDPGGRWFLKLRVIVFELVDGVRWRLSRWPELEARS